MPTFKEFDIDVFVSSFSVEQQAVHVLSQRWLVALNALFVAYDSVEQQRFLKTTHFGTRVAVEKIRSAMCEPREDELTIAGEVTKKLLADQALMQIKTLQDNQFWESCKEGINATQQADRESLRKFWQGMSKLAYCTSEDILKKFFILSQIEINISYAMTEFLRLKESAEDQAQHYFQFLKNIKIKLQYERELLCKAILKLLEEGFALNDIRGDQVLAPANAIILLQRLGALGVAEERLVLPNFLTTLTPSSYQALVDAIYQYGNVVAQKSFHKLILFRKQRDDSIQLSYLMLGGKLVMLPTFWYITPPEQKPWYLQWLLLGKPLWQKLFSAKQYFNIALLNQQVHKIKCRLSNDGVSIPCSDHYLSYQTETVAFMQDAEHILSGLLRRAKASKPFWLLAWLDPDSATLSAQWLRLLEQQQSILLEQKMAFLMHLVKSVEDELQMYEYVALSHQSPLLHPALATLEKFFEKLREELKAVKNNHWQEEFDGAYWCYQGRTNFAKRFAEKLFSRDVFAREFVTINGLEVHKFNVENINNFINLYKVYVSDSQAAAMELIGKIIKGEEYPAVSKVKEAVKLLLDKRFFNRDDQAKFITHLVGSYILPTLSDTQCSAYFLAMTLAPNLTREWLDKNRHRVEQDLQLLRTLFDRKSGDELRLRKKSEFLLIDGAEVQIDCDTVLYCIKSVVALSSEQINYVDALKRCVKEYLKEYTGNNTTYYQAIFAVAEATQDKVILVEYVTRRFAYLLREYPYYAAFIEEPFFKQFYQDIDLQKSVQSLLYQYMEKCGDVGFLDPELTKIIERFGDQKLKLQLDALLKRQSGQEELQCVAKSIVQDFCNNHSEPGLSKISFLAEKIKLYENNDSVLCQQPLAILNNIAQQFEAMLKEAIVNDHLSELFRFKNEIAIQLPVLDVFKQARWLCDNGTFIWRLYNEMRAKILMIRRRDEQHVLEFNVEELEMLLQGLPEATQKDFAETLREVRSSFVDVARPVLDAVVRLLCKTSLDLQQDKLLIQRYCEQRKSLLVRQDVCMQDAKLLGEEMKKVVSNAVAVISANAKCYASVAVAPTSLFFKLSGNESNYKHKRRETYESVHSL